MSQNIFLQVKIIDSLIRIDCNKFKNKYNLGYHVDQGFVAKTLRLFKYTL